MLRVLIPVGIVGLGLMIYSLVESIQTPRHRVRVMPKLAWIAVILLVPIIGAGLWLGFGRIREPRGGSQQPRRGPSAPDDDPEFLRKVEFERRQQQRREVEARKRAEEERKNRARGQAGPASDAQDKPQSQDRPDAQGKPESQGTSEGQGKPDGDEDGTDQPDAGGDAGPADDDADSTGRHS